MVKKTLILLTLSDVNMKYLISIKTFSTGYLCHSHLSVSCSDHLLGQIIDSGWGHRWLNISLHSKCKFVFSFILQ